MEKVWMIEKGLYSDYRIVGVYSSLENAKLAFDRLPGDDEERIEEVMLDVGIDYLKAGYTLYEVTMYLNGQVRDIKEVNWNDCIGTFTNEFYNVYGTYIGMIEKGADDNYFGGEIYAKDEAHATSIMNEKRIQMIISGSSSID
jgi:hypothetical protein